MAITMLIVRHPPRDRDQATEGDLSEPQRKAREVAATPRTHGHLPRLVVGWLAGPLLIGGFVLAPLTGLVAGALFTGRQVNYWPEGESWQEFHANYLIPADLMTASTPGWSGGYLRVFRQCDTVEPGPAVSARIFLALRSISAGNSLIEPDSRPPRVLWHDGPGGGGRAALPVDRDRFFSWVDTLPPEGVFAPGPDWAAPHVDNSIFAPDRIVIAAGWPTRAFTCVIEVDRDAGVMHAEHGWLIGSETWIPLGASPAGPLVHIPRAVPLRPIVPALLINALTWTGIVVCVQGVFTGARCARKRHRIRRGRCPSCGYPQAGGGATCPECGAAWTRFPAGT